MMNEQETNVSTRELERWLANDYASAMAGIDPRVEAQSIREVEMEEVAECLWMRRSLVLRPTRSLAR